MKPALVCRRFQRAVPGVTNDPLGMRSESNLCQLVARLVRCADFYGYVFNQIGQHCDMKRRSPLLLLVFLFFSLIVEAEEGTSKQMKENFCATGTQQQLLDFFTAEEYIVFAQGKREDANNGLNKFSDVLFLVTPDLKYFHLVTVKVKNKDKRTACIFSSAREVNFQFTSPMPGLLENKNREHLVFMENIPENGNCPPEKLNCMPWRDWSHRIKQKFVLTAYMYSAKWDYNAYDEIVELTLDNKTIHPTRGALAELARTKYGLRLRNELGEANKEQEAAKQVYREIYNEIDHGLPLMLIMLNDDRNWAVSIIDRVKGLVWTPMQGRELELYPLPRSVYEKFLSGKETARK